MNTFDKIAYTNHAVDFLYTVAAGAAYYAYRNERGNEDSDDVLRPNFWLMAGVTLLASVAISKMYTCCKRAGVFSEERLRFAGNVDSGGSFIYRLFCLVLIHEALYSINQEKAMEQEVAFTMAGFGAGVKIITGTLARNQRNGALLPSEVNDIPLMDDVD